MSEDVRRREHFPKLLPRTKRIKEVDTASNATIEEVDNYYKSFLKLYNAVNSVWLRCCTPNRGSY
mgnify:CR=1 FL=1